MSEGTRNTPIPRDTLAAILESATLAPSSHNTQPWLFSGGTDQVTIRPDLTRATPAVDPDNHHLFASLGCAAENLGLAASAAGRVAQAGPPCLSAAATRAVGSPDFSVRLRITFISSP